MHTVLVVCVCVFNDPCSLTCTGTPMQPDCHMLRTKTVREQHRKGMREKIQPAHTHIAVQTILKCSPSFSVQIQLSKPLNSVLRYSHCYYCKCFYIDTGLDWWKTWIRKHHTHKPFVFKNEQCETKVLEKKKTRNHSYTHTPRINKDSLLRNNLPYTIFCIRIENA